ncbi:MAG: hypothetical protein IKN14_00250 [Clostridiales bacterium]|nr:hypothetical protein [Clostridiales bacterium]
MDHERLRSDLEDYYGTAMYNGFPMAVTELSQVAGASDERLEKLARRAGLDLDDYED